MTDDILPQAPQGPPSRIAFISFVILMLELALIRFIPSEIKAISYFTNLLLFSAFFGLGLGCILWKFDLPKDLFPAGLFLVFAYVMASRGITIYDTGGEVHYWLQEADQRFKPFFNVELHYAAFIAFGVAMLPFITLGWQLSREMQGRPRLTAYAYDLIGSFFGTVAFALLSYLGCPPWLIIAAIGITWGIVFHGTDRNVRALHTMAALTFLCFAMAPYSSRWSPYYFVQYDATKVKDVHHPGDSIVSRITVWVNSSFHQEAINFDYDQPDPQNPDQPDKQTRVAHAIQAKFFGPYQIYLDHHEGKPPQKILILGAGSGNDVNVARLTEARLGVTEPDITAVEIDPAIASIGREMNPMGPYKDPHVKLIVDDARHFLWNGDEGTYDLILFGTLDSQTLLSGQANLRLDNYIYTTESFRDARRLLKPGGMLGTYYSVFKPWFLGRIYATVQSSFPGQLKIYSTPNFTSPSSPEYFAGAQALPTLTDNYLFNTFIVAGKDVTGFASEPDADRTVIERGQIPSSDNWPYIYIEHPTISSVYRWVFALIAIALIGIFVVLRRVETTKSLHLDFFFLGVGFSLMESAAVVRLALAFGTTWVVSAIVFATVLLTVFGANYLLEVSPKIGGSYSWLALVACILLNYFFPVSNLLALGFAARVLMSFLLIGTPVFFAGLTFSRLFKQEPDVGFPFGINMVGAMTGGCIEYFSMLFGMRSIWLILAGVYVVAFVCNRFKVRAAASPAVA